MSRPLHMRRSLHMSRPSWKEQNDSIILSSLKVWLLSFCPKHSLCKSDCLILLHVITPEWLDLLPSFFARQFSFMIEID